MEMTTVAKCGVYGALLVGTLYGVWRTFYASEWRDTSASKCSKQQRRQERNENRRNRIDTKRREKREVLKAERQRKWEEENAAHPMDPIEKQKLYDAKIALKIQQQANLEEKLNNAMDKGLRVVVDLSFLSTQSLRERNSVLKQVSSAYGIMKKTSHANLLSLHLASYTGEIAEFCDAKGANVWKVTRHEESINSLFVNEKVVFLTPDASTVLTELDPESIYVIGGIADRTVRKSETLTKATTCTIQTARLPVQEHVSVKSHVLNIDSVLLILLEVSNHDDWKLAFDRVLPKRIAK